MKIVKSIFILSSVLILSSCSITQPLMLTNNPIGNKVGTSSTASIFSGGGANALHYAPMHGSGGLWQGLIFNKKFSVADAAKNGGISKIATVDLKTSWYVFFTKKTYIVTGE